MPPKNTNKKVPLKKNNRRQVQNSRTQSQSQNIVVNINKSTRQRNPTKTQTNQRSSAPQVITIPYPVMQQQTPQQFNRPSIAIPSQSFESNFKNLSEQINNLSNRFNTQTMVTPSVVTQPITEPIQNKTEESAIISKNNLFESPSLNVDSSSKQFNRPNIDIPEINNNPVFNKDVFEEPISDIHPIENENPINEITCPFCEKKFKTEKGFEGHLKNFHVSYDTSIVYGGTKKIKGKKYDVYEPDALNAQLVVAGLKPLY